MLNSGNEGILDPGVVVDDLSGRLALDEGVGDVRVLGSRVISPNGELLNIVYGGSGLAGKLGSTSVVIQTSHGSESLGVCVLLA